MNKPLRAEGHEASVDLSRGNHDHGDVGARVLLRDVITDQTSQRTDDEDCQELQADDAL